MRVPNLFKILLGSATLTGLVLLAVLFLLGDAFATPVEGEAAAPTAEPAAPPPLPTRAPPSGSLVLSAERSGRWELYAADLGKWQQLTRDYDPARAPALSPDGKQVAFQSRRDGNWELYLLRLDSLQVARLTNSLAYDGAPSWSPDGRQLAFESYRAGDLDIWVMNADGSNPVNLTPNEPEYDYGPAWSPRGDWIAYSSWAEGHKQIMLVSSDGKRQVNLSSNPFDDEQPAWSPDGRRLSFVSNREGCEQLKDPIALANCQRREIYVADFDGARLLNVRQLTFDGHSSSPTWSPDGRSIAFTSPRPGRQQLFVVSADGGMPRALDLGPLWVGTASWTAAAVRGQDPADYPPLYVEKPIAAPASEGHPYATQPLREIYLAPSWGQLSSRVANSFLTWRARVRQESGRDFLGTLSDMTRDISFKCDEHCDNLSWHKSGRAIDTQLEYLDRSGRNLLEIVREDELGETYWRLYVRATVQDGSMGEPLKDAPWDFSYHSRTEVAPQQGGILEPLPRGYYVDVTELARLYGWQRISSHDDPDFDWRSNRLATEYWHYQKTDGLAWYDAVSELYPPADVQATFEWNRIVRAWQVDPMHIFLKNIPPPPSAWKWFALLSQ